MGGLPCKEKIILNGSGIANQATLLSSRVQAPGTLDITEEQGYEIIKHLNTAEDCLFKATQKWLESQGYDGPLPHSMTFK